jgi:ElaB/YqjD/DUF883 family membrane-anchored ribosome-binding protein
MDQRRIGETDSSTEGRNTSPDNSSNSFQNQNPSLSGQSSQPNTNVIDDVKHTAEQVVDQVKQQATNRFGEQIGQTAEILHSTSEALRSAGQQLKEKQQAPEPIVKVTQQAADQVDRVSTYLRNKDLDDLIQGAEHLAREKPATFIGGAFALGMLAARFLKSTPDQRRSMMNATGQTPHDGNRAEFNDQGPGASWNNPGTMNRQFMNPGGSTPAMESPSFTGTTTPATTGTISRSAPDSSPGTTTPSWGDTGTQQPPSPNHPGSNARVTHSPDDPSQPQSSGEGGWRQSA